MRKILLFPIISLLFTFSVCAQKNGSPTTSQGRNMKIKITVGNTVLNANLYDNVTSRAFIAKLPLTLSMQDLYSREMVYRFTDPLPIDNVQTTEYTVGEIIYWPPRHSFVIMYAQNGERFSMQKLGFIENGVEIFRTTGNVNVTFELLE